MNRVDRTDPERITHTIEGVVETDALDYVSALKPRIEDALEAAEHEEEPTP